MKSIPDGSTDTDDSDAPRERPNGSRLPGGGGGGGRGNGRNRPAASNVVSPTGSVARPPGAARRPINHSSLSSPCLASGVTTSAATDPAAAAGACLAKSGSRKTRSTAGMGCRASSANEVPADEVDVSGPSSGVCGASGVHGDACVRRRVVAVDEGPSDPCVRREMMLSFDVDPPAEGRGWRHGWVSECWGVIGKACKEGGRGRKGWTATDALRSLDPSLGHPPARGCKYGKLPWRMIE